MSEPASRYIPEVHLQAVQRSHALGRQVLLNAGIAEQDIEACEVAEYVEAHRWAWKPERVRLLLLAESHVFTKAHELAYDYATSPYLPVHLNVPTRYVRLIYCLAYGEKLLAPHLDGGTPQFWSIFGALAGTNPTHQFGAAASARLVEKVRTLKLLAEQGVWLMDASLHAVSLRQGARLPANITLALQARWWQDYGRAVIVEMQPEKILAIGKGLHSSFSAVLPFSDWIYQPQGARNLSQREWNSDVLAWYRAWLEGRRRPAER